MRLDRNLNKQGKYILIKARDLEKHKPSPAFGDTKVMEAMRVLENAGLLVYSTPGTEDEFFVIKLKDRFAQPALMRYVESALPWDDEYAKEVAELGRRAGMMSPFVKYPD